MDTSSGSAEGSRRRQRAWGIGLARYAECQMLLLNSAVIDRITNADRTLQPFYWGDKSARDNIGRFRRWAGKRICQRTSAWRPCIPDYHDSADALAYKHLRP